MFRFIHAADIHLDSPLRGLERYEGAPVEKIRLATREALENLVRLAIREKVQCLVLAGDLYDGDWKDYNTGLFMVGQFARLREAGIPVYLISGNHDADNKMTRKLPFPDNVHVFRTDAPETVLLEDHGVALHGQGFATAKVTDDISRNYPQADPRFYNIGLLHTCATGREGHETYAPCTLEGLRIKEYDYWALGHIHQREILHAREPLVVFPGNLQGRHIRETGAKGCLLVTVDHQQRTTCEFHPLDVFRWELCTLDATEFACRDDLIEQFARRLESLIEAADGKPLAVRTEIVGASPLHDQLAADRERWLYELRAIAIQEGREQLWLEKLKIRTTPPQSDEPLPTDGPLGELLQVIAEIRHAPELLQALGAELDDLHKKIPPTLQADFRLTDPAALLETLDRVEGLLAGRLLSRAED